MTPSPHTKLLLEENSNMKKLAKEQKRFCKYCGTEMEITIESAEGWSPAWSFYYTYSKYNEKTGEQNLMKVFTCPKGGTNRFSEENNTTILTVRRG